MSIKDKLAAKYAVDLGLEEDGKWCQFDGFELKIRRLSSKKAQKAREEASKKYQQDINRNKLSDEAAEEILNKQIAYGIVADWRGETFTEKTAEGTDSVVPYTPEIAMEVFGSEDMKELKTEIVQLSMAAATYKKSSDEETLGN